MANFLKGLKSIVTPGAKSAVTAASKQYAADRSLLRQGAKYVDIGTPSQNFNPSRFLKGATKP